MPRNSSGVYSLPLPPVQPNTDILSSFENTTDADIGSEITNSLDRSGRGGMLAPFKIFDGSAPAPGLSFTLEPNTGFFRKSANVIALAVGGVEVSAWDTSGLISGAAGPVKLPDGTVGAPALTFTSETNSGLYRKASGQLAYAIGGADIFTIDSTGIVLASGKTISGLPSGSAIPDPLTINTLNASTANVGVLTASGRITANGGVTCNGTLTGVTTLAVGNLSASTTIVAGGAISAGGAVTAPSLNSSGTLPFIIGGIERARFTASGYFKASPTGAYFSPSLNYHEFIQTVSDYIVGFGNSGSNPGGCIIAYSQAPNNSNQFNSFLQCIDNAASTLRFDIMANGGARGYLGNNITLSDRKLKDDPRHLDEVDISDLWNSHRDMRWCSFRYKGQKHTSVGYLAQDVEDQFPELVTDVKSRKQIVKGVYSTDLQNIGHALLSECQRRIEALERYVHRSV